MFTYIFPITTKKPLLLRKDLGNRGFFSNKENVI